MTNPDPNRDTARVFLSPPDVGERERELVAAAFDSGYVAPVGPMLDEFESRLCEYTGIEHGVALASGTAAIHLALRHLKLGPDDVVLASTLTFIGSVSPVTFEGGQLVFIDADKTSWCMDPGLLAQEVERCLAEGIIPKAVIPTDLYGQCADLDAIRDICDPHGIPVIADAAEALGATCCGRPAGNGATASIYSFNGNKIITTGGGGFLASEDEEMIAHARYLASQARDPVLDYRHSEIGFNYRLSNIAAAIGLAQLETLTDRIARRKQINNIYRAQLQDLPGLSFMPIADYGTPNYWLTVVVLDPACCPVRPDHVIAELERHNIESRPVWRPMHRQPVFSSQRVVGGDVSDYLFANGLCLPSGSGLDEDTVLRIASIVRQLITNAD